MQASQQVVIKEEVMPTISESKTEIKKVAVIDLGTNSARVLLAKIKNGEIFYRKKIIETTRLGEGVDHSKVLTERAMEDTLEAVEKFYNLSLEEGYTLFKIIGTSALRDVNNQEEFLNRIFKMTNCKVDIIDGVEEAYLGYAGVSNSFSLTEKKLVIDIGGGSTELIFGDDTVDLIESLDIGAVRMTDRCISEDPPSTKNLELLEREIDQVINDFIKRNGLYSFDKAIGIGGTITTLSGINLKMAEYNPDRIQGSSLTENELDQMIKNFNDKPFERRKEIIGLSPKRADIIIAGSIILERLMVKFDFHKVYISDYDNLEGIIFKNFLS
jgi:exopolyphosphatase/guanosine-5'-triphosphate,3'-diphosphate pyrophosphatase